MRQTATYHIADIHSFKKKLLHWASHYENSVCCMGNTSKENGLYLTYEMLVGVEALSELIVETDAFSSLKHYYDEKKDWLFGYFSYDLKNEIEHLTSQNVDRLNFPMLYFFQPKWVFTIRENEVTIHFPEAIPRRDMQQLFQQIMQTTIEIIRSENVVVKKRTSKESYQAAFESLMKHIKRGDIYEVNYCQEYYAESVSLDAVNVFENLYQLSEAPFSVFFRANDRYLMCSSPERFLKKEKQKLIAQPIKGTRQRSQDSLQDEQLKQDLLTCKKEQSENVMIVDLVRNDVSKTAQKGSVQVEELFGVYSFLQVHQMISTITSDLHDDAHWVDVIKSNFPMGSMTGAPKIRAMQLIEDTENFFRGLYSGSVGYVTPEADFDFNVVIRSIFYQSTKNYVSFAVGSAITSKANFENEYFECEVKAKAMLDVLNAK